MFKYFLNSKYFLLYRYCVKSTWSICGIFVLLRSFFKDDDTVMNFKRPAVDLSVRDNLLVVSGNPETKGIETMLPDILKQVGPEQAAKLKDVVTKDGTATAEDDDDDVPELIGNFEDASKKHENFYYKYIERWLDFIANVYEHFKKFAENVDF